MRCVQRDDRQKELPQMQKLWRLKMWTFLQTGMRLSDVSLQSHVLVVCVISSRIWFLMFLWSVWSMHRLKLFKASLLKLFKQEHAQSLPLDTVKGFVNSEHAKTPFSEGELQAAVTKMQDENQLMIADKMVFLI